MAGVRLEDARNVRRRRRDLEEIGAGGRRPEEAHPAARLGAF